MKDKLPTKRKQWQPETSHGNCGKRTKWQRNLNLTIDVLEGATIYSAADKYNISPCMVSTVFYKSMRAFRRYHKDDIEGLPSFKNQFLWRIKSLRYYKKKLIPLLHELNNRRVMTRQELRIQRAIDELIKIQDDGYGTGALAHALDALRSLESFYALNSYLDIKNKEYIDAD